MFPSHILEFLRAPENSDLFDQIFGETDLLIIFAFIFFYAIGNILLLSVRGQTVGKLLLGVQIVGYRSEKPKGFYSTVFLRIIVNGLLRIIPGYGFLDILFILSPEQRCLHDYIADTKVVRIEGKKKVTLDAQPVSRVEEPMRPGYEGPEIKKKGLFW